MTGRIRDEDIAEVRARTRIDEVVSEHVTLKPAGGGSLKGLCPFHDERSPSFHVTPSKGLYHCFGCQAGGDAITFLTELEGLTFTEAVEKLAARAGVQLRYVEGGSAPQRDRGERARLLSANRKAADFFVAQLAAPGGAAARELLAARGFDAEALARFSVGFAPDSWNALIDHLRGAGVDQQTMLAAGLVAQGSRGTYDRFRGRIIWPIRDLGGDIVGFGARRMADDSDSPKYLNTPETPLYKKSQVLYGLDLARRTIAKTQQVVVVEGYTDVMAAHLAGVTNAVATCGTAFGEDHITVLRRLLLDEVGSRGQVIFTFDSDAAGRKAALRAFENDQRFLTATYVAVDPHGLDPADLRLQHGDDAVRGLIEHRVPLFEFAIRSAIEGVDVGTVEGRTAGMRAVVPIIAGIRDPAVRPEYARVAAGWLGLPEETLLAAVRRGGPGAGRAGAGGRDGRARDRQREPEGASGRPARQVAEQLPPGLERDALRALLQHPAAVGEWLETLEGSAFEVPAYRVLYTVATQVGPPSDDNERAWAERVLEAAANDQQRAALRQLLVEPIPMTSPEPEAVARYAVSLVARLYDRDAARRQDALMARLSQVAAADAAQRRLLQEEYRGLTELRRSLLPLISAEG